MHLKTLLFVLGFAIGIFVGDKLKIASEIAIFCLIIVFVQTVVAFFFRKKESDYSLAVFTVLIFLGIFLGVIRIQLITPSNVFLCDKKCIVYGELVDSPVKRDNSQELKINLYKENINYENVSVRTPLYPEYKAGDKLILEGIVSKPEIILPTISDQKPFDYALYQKTQGVGSEMFFPKITVEATSSDNFIYKLINFKISLEKRLNNFVSSDVSPLANGILFGEDSFSKEMKDIFRIAGLSHIVVLSGLNIAIVISFVMFALRFVPLLLRVTFAFSSVILFVLMVGAEASVIRAVVMAGISLLALVSGREYVARQALILSLFVMSAYDPNLLLSSVSFHLSFLATAGIIYFSPVLEKLLEEKEIVYRLSSFVKTIFVTTLSAIVVTLPYITYTFGFVSTFALITNAILLPFVPFAMLLSALVIILSYTLPFLANILGFVDTILLQFLTYIAKIFSNLPFSYIPVSLSLTFMFVIYIFIIIGYFILKSYTEREKYFESETGEEFEVFKY